MKPNPRAEIEDRIHLIRETHRILSDSESRDAVTDGMLSHIGELLNEVDYWRSEYQRLQENQGMLPLRVEVFEDYSLSESSADFECPECKAGLEEDDCSGFSWISIVRFNNEQIGSVDIGYVHCSECGTDSPLFASKETAYKSYLVELLS